MKTHQLIFSPPGFRSFLSKCAARYTHLDTPVRYWYQWMRDTHTSEGVSRIPAAKPEKLVMRNRTARSHTHSAFECVREFLTVLSTCILYLNAVLWYSVSSRTFSVFFFRRIQYMMRKDWTQPLGIYFFFLSWVSLLICFGFSFFVWNWFCFFFLLTKWNLFSLPFFT